MKTLQDEPEDINGRCNCLAARKASRFLSAAYDKALTPVGLRATQFSILRRVIDTGGLGVSELADHMAMDRTTVTANLKPLERDGLVVIANSSDRRRRFISATDEGVARFKQALPLWTQVQHNFEEAYGPQRAAKLREALRVVLETALR
ncbi:DNA-binding MarR family transcriptional regulator [Paraburkholderia sp. GAS199]|uniref:MarR family winged helix-turn-helix transcriptional regulator n=1 Tax=Paraburkholderia sp. GAS199 TaxID=3035126 RepID=UPI003D1F7775